MDLWVASLVVVAKEGTPYKWQITDDYFKFEIFDFVENAWNVEIEQLNVK